MPPHLSIKRHPFWLCIFIAALTAGCCVTKAEQGMPILPGWLAGKPELLPPITTDELTKFEQAWPKLQVSDVMGGEPPEYWTALQTVVDLGEKSSSALVWLYAKDPPRLNPSAGISKSNFIRRVLLSDTISGRWMLPLLRYRLQWMESLLVQGELAQFETLIDELGAIQGYMNARGEESDYRMVMDFIAKLATSSDTTKRRLSMLLDPQYNTQARATDEWRKRTRPQLYAYHEMAKLTLTARGGDLTKAARLLSGQIDSLAWAFPQLLEASVVPSKTTGSIQGASNHNASAAIANKPAVTPNEEPLSSTQWSVIVVLIVTAGGLLWLLLKRRS